MSTRQQRRDWQEFREKHGVTEAQFRKKWFAMFNREPNEKELAEFVAMKAQLRKPLGRQWKYPPDKIKQTADHPLGEEKMQVGESTIPAPQVTVTKRYEWDMGHRLPKHEGKCRRLHGHRYVAEIDFTGPILSTGPQDGMVVDFYHIKTLLDDTIGKSWDHRTMLYTEDPILEVMENHQTPVDTQAEDYFGIFRVSFVPTAENIACEILRWLTAEGFPITRVRVYETPSGWAEVRA